jgi:hypothetical protein
MIPLESMVQVGYLTPQLDILLQQFRNAQKHLCVHAQASGLRLKVPHSRPEYACVIIMAPTGHQE